MPWSQMGLSLTSTIWDRAPPMAHCLESVSKVNSLLRSVNSKDFEFNWYRGLALATKFYFDQLPVVNT